MVSQTDHVDAPPAAPLPTAEPPWRPRRRLIAVVAVATGLLAAGIPTGLAYTADIADGVEVLGVELGGHSVRDATDLLRERLAERLSAPVPVRVGRTDATISPAEVGLRLDVGATVLRAAEATPPPWTALFGTREVTPVVSVDVDKLDRALQPHVGTQGTPPVWPAIRYDATTPRVVAPEPGRGLDRHTAAATVRDSWLRAGRIDLPIVDVVPATDAAGLDRLLREVAEPAVAEPVLLTVDGAEVVVPPAAIAGSLAFESDPDGAVAPRLDTVRLRTMLGTALATAETPPTDATFTVQNGQPVAVPEQPGRRVDLESAAGAIVDVLGRPAPRRVTAGVVPVPAARTRTDLKDQGIVELVSTFTTKMLAGQARNRNIKLVADLARGRIVPAGDTFSLNGLTGDRTLAKGYVMAPVIENGRLRNAPGGGVSQFATTAFNAGYYAGFVDVEHRPHSFHFDRYPAVIESTTIWPTLDMAWRNDSPHAVLIDTIWTETSLTVSLFGTKRYEIQTVYGPRTDVTSPARVPSTDPDCLPTDGIPGFHQEAWRVFTQNGLEVRREKFEWTYRAEPKTVC